MATPLCQPQRYRNAHKRNKSQKCLKYTLLQLLDIELFLQLIFIRSKNRCVCIILLTTI